MAEAYGLFVSQGEPETACRESWDQGNSGCVQARPSLKEQLQTGKTAVRHVCCRLVSGTMIKIKPLPYVGFNSAPGHCVAYRAYRKLSGSGIRVGSLSGRWR
jgi:hypothetical protein